jgi:protocatechuate 3,4-dioxygenase beta subunit
MGFRDARETLAVAEPGAVAGVELKLRRLGPEEEQAGITGIVRDASGQPMAGALVWTEVPGWPQVLRRMEPPGSLPKEARTGADGSFTLRVPQIGGTTFEVLASAPGLAVSRAGPFPQHPEEQRWPFVELQLVEGASLEGRVTSLDGAAVPGARVRLWRTTQVPEEATLFTRLVPQAVGQVTYAAVDGTFRLRRLEPGAYWLEALAPGHAAQPVGPVEVRAGSAPARIDIALAPGGSIAGRVVDTSGEPLAAIEVVALSSPPGAGPAAADEDELVQSGAIGSGAALTESDGSFRIDHLPDGDYRLLARARGFEPASAAASVPGEPLPDLVMAPHASIVASVREETTGAPVPSFAVRLERRDAGGDFHDDSRQARDVADAAGRFACDGLRAGEWRVRVLAPSRVPWAREVSLEPGDQVELDVALGPGRRLEGVVRRPDGAPIAGAAVTLRRDGEGRDLESAHSGVDGAFGFGGLEDGSYLVQASHPEQYAEPGESAAKVKLDGEDAAVRLVLRPAGKILGRLRGLVFRPPGWDIFVVHFAPLAGTPPHAAFQVWTDENGAFQKDSVRPGTYRLELTHRRRAPDTGGDWISVPPEARPLGEVEVRAGEMARFEMAAE